ncbi:MAG: SpoIIE family protein phosphatase, partial [Ignavibacterium sp.]
ITESKNKFYEDFGGSRFIETIKTHSHKNVNQIAQEIISQISLFTNDSTQYDDITLLILRWNKN